jgi:hypothetical protein
MPVVEILTADDADDADRKIDQIFKDPCYPLDPR